MRGAVERTYVLRTAAASIGLDELAKMSRDEHRQAFLAYVAGLIGVQNVLASSRAVACAERRASSTSAAARFGWNRISATGSMPAHRSQSSK